MRLAWDIAAILAAAVMMGANFYLYANGYHERAVERLLRRLWRIEQ